MVDMHLRCGGCRYLRCLGTDLAGYCGVLLSFTAGFSFLSKVLSLYPCSAAGFSLFVGGFESVQLVSSMWEFFHLSSVTTGLRLRF